MDSKEDWKYTDLSKFDLKAFHALEDSNHEVPTEEALLFIQSLLIDPKSSNQILFYNGNILLKPHSSRFLIKSVGSNSDAQKNLELTFPQDTIISDPIYLIYVTQSDEISFRAHPKNIIIAEKSSKATLVEIYLTLGKSPSFLNTVTHIEMANGARLQHLFLHYTVSQSLQIAEIQIKQASNSYYQGTSVVWGGSTHRTDFSAYLQGERAECQCYAFTAAKQRQQLDIHFNVDHEQPNCESFMLARGLAQDQARNAFSGKIVVLPGAKKTKAFLESKNLLLSEQAEADTRPLLEIHHDDVQCSHGATISQLDPEALFYLKSRGIPESTAKQLLIDSFIAPSLQGLSALQRTYVTRLLHEY